MNQWMFWFGLLLFPSFLSGQENVIMEGRVTYKNSKNVYVKFAKTDLISIGDTLILMTETKQVKALLVKQKSSISCITELITPSDIVIGQKVIFLPRVLQDFNDEKTEIPANNPTEINGVVTQDSIIAEKVPASEKRKATTTGRLTFTTNASINPDEQNSFQRIRASATFNIHHIHQSAFSLQTYLTYRHRYGIDQSNADFFDDFKIFSLALHFAPNKKYQFTLGRKINQNIANMGAIDGLQGEYFLGKYTAGFFMGTRPDFENFTFNAKLPQFGAYLVRNDATAQGNAQTSIAIAEQQNDFKTDRRFIYFQHNNSLLKNLNFFLSSEIDLFENVKGEKSSHPKLTSMYVSLRYRMRRNLSFSGSYDNRRNIIYYESYQTFIDQLLAQETRQGFRFQSNYSPFKKISINASVFYRYQGNNAKPTSNYIVHVNFNNIIRKSAAISANINLLESLHFKGTILGGRISDQFFKGKLNTEVNFRNIHYSFFNSESGLRQNIAGIQLSFNILKKTSLMVSYEGTFEPSRTWHRYFITITQRIKN